MASSKVEVVVVGRRVRLLFTHWWLLGAVGGASVGDQQPDGQGQSHPGCQDDQLVQAVAVGKDPGHGPPIGGRGRDDGRLSAPGPEKLHPHHTPLF